tara:strand:- start:494 stop:1510 length:1017 start_codon:yes stop_codon:yes gene_type:complete
MKKFWKNKNVFITGINGFIGGNLAKNLISHKANVFGLIRDEKRNTFIYYENLEKKITLINGDLNDQILIQRVIDEYSIDIVFHFAAQVEVGIGLANPFYTFETNIRGTYSLLESIKKSKQKVRSIIVASSDKAYGSYPKSAMPYKEHYPLIPQFPYDVSKACADMISKSYSIEPFKMPIIVTRFCNIYGPGQLNFSAVIPDGIRSALNYSSFTPRGNGTQVRDFIYVQDVAELYMKMAEEIFIKPEKMRGEVFNAGTNKGYNVREILELIFKLCDNKEEFNRILKKMKNKKTTGEINLQIMDHKKIKKYIGWQPRYNLKTGLTETISWFSDYLKKSNL